MPFNACESFGRVIAEKAEEKKTAPKQTAERTSLDGIMGLIEQVVARALNDSDPNVIRCGIRLAGMHSIAGSIDAVISHLSHQAWQLRAAAAETLGRLKAEKARPLLVKKVGGDVPSLRQRVLSCAALSSKSAPEQTKGGTKEEEVWQVKKAAAIALNRIDPSIAENPLLQALDNDNPQVIIAAMNGLVSLESSRAGERIVPFLDSADAEVKKATVVFTGILRITEAAPKLMGLLEDKTETIRREAIIALNHVKLNDAIPAVMKKMTDPHRSVRTVAAVFLGNTGKRDENTLSVLRAALKDPAAEVRQAAADSLSNLGAVEALEDILGLLMDKDERVRRSAGVAVNQLLAAQEMSRYE